MCLARHIDDLLQDPEFLASPEYGVYKALVEQGAYPSVRDAILSVAESTAQVRRDDLAAWPDEIQAAIEADLKGRAVPPMYRVASCISDALEMGTPHIIPESHWRMLIDFLCRTHRAKRGATRTEFNRQCDADVLLMFEQLVASGISDSRAHEHLSETERADIRTIQRTINRATNDREIDTLMKDLSSHSMTRFFERREGDDT